MSSASNPRRIASVGLLSILLALSLYPPAAQAGEDLLQPRFAGRQHILLNTVVGRSSVYRDPNWDWTANATYTLKTPSQTFVGVRLPYYASGGPAARDLNVSSNRDIAPADGWVLVLRDFGPVAVPYFILYNRYRGILRFFYYSTLPQTFSKVVGRLSFQGSTTSTTAGFFTLIDDQKMYLDDYNPAKSQIAVGQVEWQRWAYLDFDVSGYDPAVGSKNDPTLVLEITGVTETSLVASGTLDLTTMTTNATKSSGSGFNVGGLYKNVLKRDKEVSELKTWVTKKATDNPSQWWSWPIRAIAGLTNTSWFGALGPVAGILDFVIGGGSRSSNPPAPLSTRGTVDLKGTLTTQGALYSLILRVPGSHHLTPAIDADSNILPLYDTPLGVFNVLSKPSYAVTLTSDTIQILPTGPWTIDAESHATKSMQVTWNTHVFSGASVLATWAPKTRLAEGWRSLSSFNSSWTWTWWDGGDVLYEDLFYSELWNQVGLKTTLTPIGGGVNPTILYKLYPVTSSITRRNSPSGPPWF